MTREGASRPGLRVASYNIHMGRTQDGRPFDVTSVVERMDADVVVLQEERRGPGDEGSAAGLARTLDYELVFQPYYQGPLASEPPGTEDSAGEIGLALLSRHPIVDHGVRPLWRIPGDPASRVVVDVEIRDACGLHWRVHGTHVSWLPHGSVPQLAQLRRLLGAPRRREVLVGDMNMWGPVVGRLLRGWRRAVSGRTWPNPRPHSQIDHILTGPDLHVDASGVLADGGSDHRPVWADLVPLPSDTRDPTDGDGTGAPLP